MIENLIVALIVGASAWYAGRKYLPAKLVGKAQADTGCASGCGTCKSGCDTPAEPAARRVIPIRAV